MKLKKSLSVLLISSALFSMCTGTMVEASKENDKKPKTSQNTRKKSNTQGELLKKIIDQLEPEWQTLQEEKQQLEEERKNLEEERKNLEDEHQRWINEKNNLNAKIKDCQSEKERKLLEEERKNCYQKYYEYYNKLTSLESKKSKLDKKESSWKKRNQLLQETTMCCENKDLLNDEEAKILMEIAFDCKENNLDWNEFLKREHKSLEAGDEFLKRKDKELEAAEDKLKAKKAKLEMKKKHLDKKSQILKKVPTYSQRSKKHTERNLASSLDDNIDEVFTSKFDEAQSSPRRTPEPQRNRISQIDPQRIPVFQMDITDNTTNQNQMLPINPNDIGNTANNNNFNNNSLNNLNNVNEFTFNLDFRPRGTQLTPTNISTTPIDPHSIGLTHEQANTGTIDMQNIINSGLPPMAPNINPTQNNPMMLPGSKK